jgi:hypothetical protein
MAMEENDRQLLSFPEQPSNENPLFWKYNMKMTSERNKNMPYQP